MPVSEKRARFMQQIETQLKAAKPEKASEIGSIKNIITNPPMPDKKMEEVFACISRLEERIDLLEAQMRRHFGNSKLVESEIDRLVSDRWESLSKETDDCLTRMTDEMQDLRDIVIGLRSSVRAMEK